MAVNGFLCADVPLLINSVSQRSAFYSFSLDMVHTDMPKPFYF